MQKLLDQGTFLTKYRISEDSFLKSSLKWSDIEQVYQQHLINVPNLEATANYIADRLRHLPQVHSLRIRVKNPEHLIEKIIRKQAANPALDVTPSNFAEKITDLIGVRALHLFKDEWIAIHEFIAATWELNVAPVANVRRGDPEELTQLFRDKGCDIHEHQFGYRSVHYLVMSRPAKDLYLAELQVRTIFEEGWSEIDHRIRYPYDTDNPIFGEFLVIFNRLAGSADEMGSFIKFLQKELQDREEEYKRAVNEYDRKIKSLQTEIHKLRIGEQQKRELQEKIASISFKPYQLNLESLSPEQMAKLKETIAPSLAVNLDLKKFSYAAAARSLAANLATYQKSLELAMANAAALKGKNNERVELPSSSDDAEPNKP